MTPQELKNSILQLAIQGKLVEQDEDDTPVDLTGIKPRKTDDFEFEIPEIWELAHLESITNGISSKQYQILESEVQKTGEFPVISQSKAYSIGFTDKTEKVYHHDRPVIVFGDHTTEVKYVEFDFVVGADGIKIFEPICKIITAEFLYYVLQFYSKDLSKVGRYSRHYKFLKNKPIPIPPLAEQKRIVAKIEELLPYIDRYEQAWSRLEAFNRRFPDDMKKSILQLAIRGKLVEQRPEGGTAEELYQQIQEEKQRLIKLGKIKKEKPLLDITEDEKPFDIPESWKWIKIGDIFSVVRGSSPRPKGSPLYWANIETEFNWITIKDISTNTQDGILLKTIEHLTAEGAKLSTYIEKGEVIIAVSGSTTGKYCILGIDGYIYDGLAAVLNPTKIVSNKYVYYFFSWIYEKLNSKKIGSAFPNINTDILKNTLMPLPPFAEQKRIVARLEELLPLCERLK